MIISSSENWFYKMGIVGFDRIIQYNSKNYDLDLNKYNYKIKKIVLNLTIVY